MVVSGSGVPAWAAAGSEKSPAGIRAARPTPARSAARRELLVARGAEEASKCSEDMEPPLRCRRRLREVRGRLAHGIELGLQQDGLAVAGVAVAVHGVLVDDQHVPGI